MRRIVSQSSSSNRSRLTRFSSPATCFPTCSRARPPSFDMAKGTQHITSISSLLFPASRVAAFIVSSPCLSRAGSDPTVDHSLNLQCWVPHAPPPLPPHPPCPRSTCNPA